MIAVYSKMVVTAYDRADIHINSQRLQLQAQDQHTIKTKPDQIPAWTEDGFMKSHIWMRSCWPVMTAGGEKLVFFGNVAPERLVMV